MNKLELTLHIIIMLLFISASIGMGMYIEDKGGDTLCFCKEHYRNETFLSDFIGDDPAVLKSCCLNQSKSLGLDYCKEYVDDYQKCMVTNGTDDQRRFILSCHWMGPDYLIMVGELMFFFFIPIGLLGINIAMLYEWNKKRKAKKK